MTLKTSKNEKQEITKDFQKKRTEMENNIVRLSMFREKKHTEEREVLLKSCKHVKN